jgi:tetratricopeptide (TPR) repeat protein
MGASLGCSATTQGAVGTPMERGRAAFEEGRVAVAVSAFEEARRENATDKEALRWLARAYDRSGNLVRAEESWHAVVERDPEDWDAWARLGRVRQMRSRYHSAIVAFEKALSDDADDPVLVIGLAECEVMADRPADALQRVDTALESEDDSAGLHLVRGRALHALSRPDEAVEAFRRADELQPEDTDALLEMGTVYEELDFLGRASTVYRRVLALQPDHVEVLSRLGRVLVQSGQMSEALPHLVRATRLRPDSIAELNNLGVAYRETGLYAEAVTAFEAGLALNPDQIMLHANLSEALYRLHRFADAATHLRRGISGADPTHAAAWQAALRRVVLTEALRLARCPRDGASAVLQADALEQLLKRHWEGAGFEPASFQAALSDLLSDQDAMGVLGNSIQECSDASLLPAQDSGPVH